MCENVPEHQKQTAIIAPNSHIHQDNVVNASQSDAVNSSTMKVAVDRRFILTRLLPSYFPFPVTFEQFKKYTHYEEPLEAITKELIQSNPTAYSTNLNDSSVEKTRLLHDYYEVFYMRPEIRQRYPLRLRPCPGAMKKKLLKIPFVDDDDELDYNANSPACKRQRIATPNTTNETQESQKPREVTTSFLETETNNVVADNKTELLHDTQSPRQNADIEKETFIRSINLIPVKRCYTEAFIKGYIARNVSTWSEDVKAKIRTRIAAAKDAQNQLEKEEENRVEVQSVEILKSATETVAIIETAQETEVAEPAIEIVDTIDITNETGQIQNAPELNYPKQCMLGYVLRMTTGPKHNIVKVILAMSLDEFLQNVHVHSCPNTVSIFDLELIYQFAIVEQKIWPLNMYIKLCDLLTYLQKKSVSVKNFNLEHISPKLLHWKDLREFTDYDKCVNLDYFKRTGESIRNAKLLQEQRQDYYKRCWLYEQWIWRVPQITHKQLLENLQVALDMENSIQNLFTEDESTIPFEGVTVLTLEEYYKRKAAVNKTPTKSTTPTQATNATTPTTSILSAQISQASHTTKDLVETSTKPTTATNTPSKNKSQEREKVSVYVISYNDKTNVNNDDNIQLHPIAVDDNANNNSNNTYMQLQETRSKITSTQQSTENPQNNNNPIPFVQIPKSNNQNPTQSRANETSTQSPNLFASGSSGSQASQSAYLHNYSFVNMPNTQDQIASLPEDQKDVLQLPETDLASICANAAKSVEPIIKQEFKFLKNLQFIVNAELESNDYICLPMSEQVINVLDDSVQDGGVPAVQRINCGNLGSLVNSPPLVADDTTHMPDEVLQNTALIENVTADTSTQKATSSNSNINTPTISLKSHGSTFKLLPITLLDPRSGKVIRVVQPVATTTRVSDNVPQLTHKFRALPIQISNAKSTGKNPPNKPTTSTTVDGMTVSQALAVDSTFFNSQLLHAIATPTQTTTTQPPTSQPPISTVATAPTSTTTTNQ